MTGRKPAPGEMRTRGGREGRQPRPGRYLKAPTPVGRLRPAAVLEVESSFEPSSEFRAAFAEDPAKALEAVPENVRGLAKQAMRMQLAESETIIRGATALRGGVLMDRAPEDIKLRIESATLAIENDKVVVHCIAREGQHEDEAIAEAADAISFQHYGRRADVVVVRRISA